ncbi:MAG: prephenate dehydratase [Bacteroidota bacterium]
MLNAETKLDPSQNLEEKPLRVCIQGYKGAFHEIAARHCFDQEKIEIVPAHTFDELVQRIEKKDGVDIGLMAIENSLAGSLMYNYKLLNESDLNIIGEVYLRIKQNLMVLPGVKIENLKEVHSHPMAIAQSRKFFEAHPHIRLVEMEDTALAAKAIREKGLKDVGAIASTLAAEVYDMEIIAPGIETNKKNHTRFLILDNEEFVPKNEPEKVSLCFAVDHTVGSLYKVLAVLAAYNINLTKIQSTPIVGHPWEYFFFIDFLSEGMVSYSQAIEAIRPLTHNLKVLGAYKQGKHYEY